MWNVKVKVIPITIGATGTISKSLRNYLSNTLEKHKIKELQITVILDTAHILWKALTKKYKTCLTCEITLYVAQIVNTEHLQQYIP